MKIEEKKFSVVLDSFYKRVVSQREKGSKKKKKKYQKHSEGVYVFQASQRSRRSLS